LRDECLGKDLKITSFTSNKEKTVMVKKGKGGKENRVHTIAKESYGSKKVE
jgi:hypothetical protein